MMSKKPWTNQPDLTMPKEKRALVRVYFFNEEPMFGMGSTSAQHALITKNLNISYNKGLQDGKEAKSR
jgi:hypothetical protein